ncbi:MAG: hypothetical protein R3B35_02825 [Gemmatimonadales bacterium]
MPGNRPRDPGRDTGRHRTIDYRPAQRGIADVVVRTVNQAWQVDPNLSTSTIVRGLILEAGDTRRRLTHPISTLRALDRWDLEVRDVAWVVLGFVFLELSRWFEGGDTDPPERLDGRIDLALHVVDQLDREAGS